MTTLRDLTLQDDAGNPFASAQSADGGYHLATAAIQAIQSSTVNSTTTNLAASATFTGTADETFGINGIQVYHYADQDCTIHIDQSLDGTNWDISDSFDFLANTGYTRTIISVAPYYRARVTNDGASTTTAMRFATGMTPVINPLPRTLSTNGNVQVVASIRGDENTGRHAWISPVGTIGTNPIVRLVGTNFDGTTKDANFWDETITNAGSVVQSGEIKLQTNTTANGTAKYESGRRARFVVGSAMLFTGAYKFNGTVTEADNVRRCGAYDADNGFFFELDGSTFSVGSRSSTADTLVSSGSFNGTLGTSFTVDPAAYYKLDIEWTPIGAFYYINSRLLHQSVGGHLTRFLTLPITMENSNDNGNTTAVVFDCLGVVISRQGELETAPTSFYSGAAETRVLKVGAGDLHRITVTDNAGTMMVYDGLTAGGTLLASLDATKTVGTMEFNLPFSDGLTIVAAGALKMTVVYE